MNLLDVNQALLLNVTSHTDQGAVETSTEIDSRWSVCSDRVIYPADISV